MHLYLRIFLLFVASTTLTESAKILGIFVMRSRSHHSINQPIVKGLATRGHEVTIISYFKSNTTVPNYTEILIPEGVQNFIDSVSIEETGNFTGLWNYIKAVNTIEKSSCEKVLGLDYIQEIVNSKQKIDLIIAEVYHVQCYHLLAYKLNVPIILISPPSVLMGVDYFLGNPYNPSVTPLVISMFTTNMNFFQRLENTFQYVVLYWYQNYVFNKDLKEFTKYLDMELPSNEDLNRRTALALYNNHFSFISRPKAPNIIDIGGIHIKEPKTLPEDIEKFINESKHGVILFSFGSTIKASSISPEKLDVIKDAFSAIPQRVLWRVNELNLTDVPSNVKLGKWFPQRDILEHKNVKAFISHCGLFGTLEAIHTATPIIAIPFMFDQIQDANILVEQGAAIYVDYFTLDKDTLVNAINNVIFDNKYSENMQKLSRVFKDRPIPALDEALYWSEYVLKYQGAPHMRLRSADMPLYQYLLLDVLAFVMVVVFSILYSCKCLISIIYSVLWQQKKEKKKTQ